MAMQLSDTVSDRKIEQVIAAQPEHDILKKPEAYNHLSSDKIIGNAYESAGYIGRLYRGTYEDSIRCSMLVSMSVIL